MTSNETALVLFQPDKRLTNETNTEEQFFERIDQLLQSLKAKKLELKNGRRALRDDKKKLKKEMDSFTKKKILCTSINCLALGAGGVACFIPGLNLVVWGSIVVSVASTGTNMAIDNNNDESVKKIMAEIDRKTTDKISAAELVNKRQKDFSAERERMIVEGMDPEQAEIDIVLQIIEGSFRGTAAALYNSKTTNMNHYGWNVPAWVGRAFSIGKPMEKLLAYFARALPGITLSANMIKNIGYLAAAVAIVVDICQTAKVCSGDSKALLRCDEISDLIEDAEDSLDYFIDILRSIKDSQNQRMIRESNAGMNEMNNTFNQELNDIRTQMDNMEVENRWHLLELRNAFRQQIESQMHALTYAIHNGVRQLPPSDGIDQLNSEDQ